MLNTTITVSQVNRYIKNIIEENPILKNVYMVGEISNFTNHYQSGHFYLTLKDEKSSIKCIMFKSFASNVPFEPKNGMKIVVKGSVSVYEPNGNYQFYIKEMVPFGEGSYKIAFDQVKNKLEKKGYFDESNKKNIKKNITKMGIISSVGSAGLKDVLSVVERRNPLIKIVVFPAIMQGNDCVSSVISAMNSAQNFDIDVLLITRGGGSVEDLWQFNSELLAEKVFEYDIPVVSAIGHEVDISILDFVADLHAGTPSIAGEFLANTLNKDVVNEMFSEIKYLINEKIQTNQDCIDDSNPLISKANLLESIQFKNEKVQQYEKSLKDGIVNFLEAKQLLVDQKIQTIDMISVQSILKRGYSVMTKNNVTIKSVKQIEENDNISITLKDGNIDCIVKKININGE